MAKQRTKKYKFSKATRAAMSRSHTGLKLSDETKAKISMARRERQRLIELGLLPKFQHTPKTKRLLSRLMKARRHKPTKQARKKSIQMRSARSGDRRDEKLAKKLARG